MQQWKLVQLYNRIINLINRIITPRKGEMDNTVYERKEEPKRCIFSIN